MRNLAYVTGSLAVACFLACSSANTDDGSSTGTTDGDAASNVDTDGSTSTADGSADGSAATYKGGAAIQLYSASTSSSLIATFAATDPSTPLPNCVVETFGACTVRTCEQAEAGLPTPPEKYPNAGIITATGGTIVAPGVSIEPNGDRGAYPLASGVGGWWIGGDTITVTAAGSTNGGGIGAFTDTLTTPNSDLSIASPVFSSSAVLPVPQANDFTFTWSVGTMTASGKLTMLISSQNKSFMTCSFDIAPKTGVIQAAALQKMQKGTGVLSAAVITESTAAHSDYLVSYTLTSPAHVNGEELTPVTLDFQ